MKILQLLFPGKLADTDDAKHPLIQALPQLAASAALAHGNQAVLDENAEPATVIIQRLPRKVPWLLAGRV